MVPLSPAVFCRPMVATLAAPDSLKIGATPTTSLKIPRCWKS